LLAIGEPSREDGNEEEMGNLRLSFSTGGTLVLITALWLSNGYQGGVMLVLCWRGLARWNPMVKVQGWRRMPWWMFLFDSRRLRRRK
jgi:hypothetical protein